MTLAPNKSIFDDESKLSEEYVPKKLPERQDELDALDRSLSPITRGSDTGANNCILVGKAGQGKTAAVRARLRRLREVIEEYDEPNDVTVIWFNCTDVSGSWGVYNGIIKQELGKDFYGYDTSTVRDEFIDYVFSHDTDVLIVLDEINNITDDYNFFYNISRPSEVFNGYEDWGHNISILGTTNDQTWRDGIPQKIKDSLYDDKVHFDVYDSNQLRSILYRRAEDAFVDGALSNGVIPKCAALAAQDVGSARQALMYLQTAGEVASAAGADEVTEEHVEEAVRSIEQQDISDGLIGMTTEDKLALIGVIRLERKGETPARTKEVYYQYKQASETINREPNGMRSCREHLLDLEMMGFLEKSNSNQGIKGGQSYKFSLDVDMSAVIDGLSTESYFDDIVEPLREDPTLNDYGA